MYLLNGVSGWTCWLKGGVGKQDPEGFFVLFPELIALNYDQLIEKTCLNVKGNKELKEDFGLANACTFFIRQKR